MATSLIFLTPLWALLALGAVVPLAALYSVRRRATRVRRNIGLSGVRPRRLLVPVSALLAVAGLLGLAAAQPILEQTSTRHVRTTAEVFVVLDVSRSMLAKNGLGSPERIDRAKAAASELRAQLPAVPFGIASFTDRALPHLFPSANPETFAATLDRSIGVERPPPSSSLLTNATKLDALTAIRGLRYFSPKSRKRLVVVLTDGESLPVAGTRLGTLYRRTPAIDLLFIQFWGENERVFTRGAPEPQYRADPSARAILDGLAASTNGSVYSERQLDSAATRVRQVLGKGPTEARGQRRGREALAPYFALAAFLPLGVLLWRRDR